MEERINRLKELLEKSELNAEEIQWLLDNLDNTSDSELMHVIEKNFSEDLKNDPVTGPGDSGKLLEAIQQKIGSKQILQVSRIASIRKFAVAASVIGIILFGAIFFLKVKENNKPAETVSTHKFKNDVMPGGNKATLTLADGSLIVLDNTEDGTLAHQGSSTIIKSGGKLSYAAAGQKNEKEILYNTVATPMGGQYQLELPDGSLVWLNASSSIRFPTSFIGKIREVTITGEAYFEVARNLAKPFHVSVNGSEVQVLGTHFNINAYGDEEGIRTTLLEGAVRFVSGDKESMLKPGQQSLLSEQGMLNVINDVDVNEAVAWKNGYFGFYNAGIEKIMRQLSRWYDVDIEYRGKTEDLFIAEMNRNIRLSDALKALELTGRIKFEIDGRKIIVMP